MLFDEVQVVLARIESQHGHLVAPLLDPVLVLGWEKLEIIRKILLTNDFLYQVSSSAQLVDKVCNELLGIGVAYIGVWSGLVCHQWRQKWGCARSRR